MAYNDILDIKNGYETRYDINYMDIVHFNPQYSHLYLS
jgi:hypothetical protein